MRDDGILHASPRCPHGPTHSSCVSLTGPPPGSEDAGEHRRRPVSTNSGCGVERAVVVGVGERVVTAPPPDEAPQLVQTRHLTLDTGYRTMIMQLRDLIVRRTLQPPIRLTRQPINDMRTNVIHIAPLSRHLTPRRMPTPTITHLHRPPERPRERPLRRHRNHRRRTIEQHRLDQRLREERQDLLRTHHHTIRQLTQPLQRPLTHQHREQRQRPPPTNRCHRRPGRHLHQRRRPPLRPRPLHPRTFVRHPEQLSHTVQLALHDRTIHCVQNTIDHHRVIQRPRRMQPRHHQRHRPVTTIITTTTTVTVRTVAAQFTIRPQLPIPHVPHRIREIQPHTPIDQELLITSEPGTSRRSVRLRQQIQMIQRQPTLHHRRHHHRHVTHPASTKHRPPSRPQRNVRTPCQTMRRTSRPITRPHPACIPLRQHQRRHQRRPRPLHLQPHHEPLQPIVIQQRQVSQRRIRLATDSGGGGGRSAEHVSILTPGCHTRTRPATPPATEREPHTGSRSAGANRTVSLRRSGIRAGGRSGGRFADHNGGPLRALPAAEQWCVLRQTRVAHEASAMSHRHRARLGQSATWCGRGRTGGFRWSGAHRAEHHRLC